MVFKNILFNFYGCIVILLFCTQVHAQQPFTKNYEPKEYKAEPGNWDVEQDDDGLIYVANNEGVLIFDGNHWQLIPVNGRTALDIHFTKKFGLLVGTVNDFGALKKDELGNITYQSYSSLFPEEFKPIRTVFKLTSYNDAVFIETQRGMFKYDGKSIKAFPIPEFIISSYIVNKDLYVVSDSSIYQFINEEFKPIHKTRFKEFGEVFFITSDEDNSLLIGFDENKIIRFPDGINGKGEVWNSKLIPFFNQQKLYVNFSKPNQYKYRFFPSNGTGLFVLDQKGNPIMHLDRKDGLISNNINSVFLDKENNLWLTSEKGITKLNFDLPFTRYSKESGLTEPFLSVLEHKGFVYVGTNFGLYVKTVNESQFTLVPNTLSQIRKIIPADEGVLVAGGNQGLFYIKGKTFVSKLLTPTSVMTIGESSKYPNIFYAGLFDGFWIVQLKNKTIKLVKNVSSIGADVRTVLEDYENNLWMGTRFDGLFKLDISSGFNEAPKQYTTNNGFSSLEHNQVYGTPRSPIFSSRDAYYRYDSRNDTLIEIKYPLVPQAKLYPVLNADGLGNLWSLNNRYIFNQKEPRLSDSTSLMFFKSNLVAVSTSHTNSYWIATNDAIFKLDLPLNLPETAGKLHPKQIHTLPDYESLPFSQLNDTLYSIDLASKKMEGLEFSFAYPTFIQEEQVRFRSRIEEISPNWSKWTSNSTFTYSNLPFGKYHLQVEAISGVGKYEFPITIEIIKMRPWYRSLLAYFIYVGLILSGVWYVIHLRNNQILKRNQYLEHLVLTRTDEISTQNNQLKELAAEMANANQLKSKLLQMAVHDLRNPLSVLIGYCDFLQDEDNAAQQDTIITSMERVVEKMLGSTETLLNVDENGTSQANRERQTIDLRGIVLDVISDNSILANRKKQTIESDLEPNCSISGDRYQITEVFENLINNAIKYSPFETQIKVDLIKKLSKDGNLIQFKVSDSGPGVKKEDQQRIFSPYSKSENTPTGGEASSGLGLSIVREIVAWHNGKVWVEKNPNNAPGSTFYIEFPVSAE